MARALAAHPPLLLMDEPFGALDPLTRRRVQDDFKELQARLGITVVLVTHDVPEALRLADEVVVLDRGQVAQQGPPRRSARRRAKASCATSWPPPFHDGALGFLAERGAELRLLIAQHVVLVLAATAAAVAVGVPLGLVLTRRPRLARVVLAAAGIVQTIPSLALFGFLIPLPFIGGIGARTAIAALIVYALLPILRNTYVGVRQVDPAVLEAATAMGMTPGQRLRMVEVPLALPVILGGVRIATVVSVGTATIAAAIGAGGLGTYVFRGLATMDTRLVLAGAIPAAVLAVVADGLLARVERSRRPARAAAALAGAAAVILAWAAVDARRGPSPQGGRRLQELHRAGPARRDRGRDPRAGRRRRGPPPRTWAAPRSATRRCVSGQADVYVEYTGTALRDVLKERTRSDPREVLAIVRGPLPRARPARSASRSASTTPSPWSCGGRMRSASASARISDLRPHAASIRVGLFGEFLEREDGLPGLVAAYGLAFRPAAARDGPRPALPGPARRPGGPRGGQRHRRPHRRSRPRGAGGRSPLLPALRRGDHRARGPASATPPWLARWPACEGRIDAAAMRRMNLAVDGAHRSPAEVAREFLRLGPATGPRTRKLRTEQRTDRLK